MLAEDQAEYYEVNSVCPSVKKKTLGKQDIYLHVPERPFPGGFEETPHWLWPMVAGRMIAGEIQAVPSGPGL